LLAHPAKIVNRRNASPAARQQRWRLGTTPKRMRG